MGRDVQRGLVIEKAFDLDLEIWLQFTYAETGSGEKEVVSYQQTHGYRY